MDKIQILYLTERMDNYSGATYQREIINEIQKKFKVFLYGPGYEHFDMKDNISDIISKAPFKIQVLIMGHSWLSDEKKNDKISAYSHLDFSVVQIPKIAIINKEYVNLTKKLEYIKKNKFDICFTHHHDAKKYEKEIGIRFYYWPFAMNADKFLYNGEPKKNDFAFSGILKNHYHKQSDKRLEIMKELFFSVFHIPLIKKPKYRNKKIVWNVKPINLIAKIYNKFLFNFYHFHNDDEYANFIKESKIYLNTFSPADLISPRYFECMAAKSLILCEETNLYENLFPKNTYVTFQGIESFRDKLNYYLNNDGEREKIVNNAFLFVKENHSWKARVIELEREIQKIFKKKSD